MNAYGVILMGRRRRRRPSAEFKTAVSMLRKWVLEAEHKTAPVCGGRSGSASAYRCRVRAVGVAGAGGAAGVQIELRRAGTSVKIVWLAVEAAQCAAWLAEWLR